MSSDTAVSTRTNGRRGFGSLFVVDLWERFSFYGLAAILVLYLTTSADRGGQALDGPTATAVFASYLALSFVAGLPGGWLADRVLGARRAVVTGACLVIAGHVVLAAPVPFYVGLVFVALGTGMIKPAMAGMVAAISGGGAHDREATFSLFYMSIQASALVAPLVVGALAEKVAWHLGFAAAAVGMACGLVQFLVGLRRFGDLGRTPVHPVEPAVARKVLRTTVISLAVVVTVLVVIGNPQAVLGLLGITAVLLPLGYLLTLQRKGLFANGPRLGAFTALMSATSLFWMLFAQSGSALGLFAQQHTNRVVAGFEVPASWFQAAHPLFVLLVAPVFAVLWVRAGDRLTVRAKFGGALLLGGASFVLMAVAAVAADTGAVSPLWLLGVHLLLACGEIVVGPIGLALAAAVAPDGYENRFLALSGMFGAAGVVLGGQLYRLTSVLPLSVYFGLMGGAVAVVGLVLPALGKLAVGTNGR